MSRLYTVGIDSCYRRNYLALSGAGTSQCYAADESSSAENVVAEVARLLARAGSGIEQVERIVVTRGPGSFTGLRSALASAQGLSLGGSIALSAVPALLAAATARFEGDGVYVVWQKASPNDEFVSVYHLRASGAERSVRCVAESRLVESGKRESVVAALLDDADLSAAKRREIDVSEVVENAAKDSSDNPALWAIAAAKLLDAAQPGQVYCSSRDYQSALAELDSSHSLLYVKGANAKTLAERRAAGRAA